MDASSEAYRAKTEALAYLRMPEAEKERYMALVRKARGSDGAYKLLADAQVEYDAWKARKEAGTPNVTLAASRDFKAAREVAGQ